MRDAGLASSASAHNYTPTELGVFGVTAETKPEDAHACVDTIKDVIERIRAGDFEAADVERAQSIHEARMLRGLETMEGQASFLAEWEALGDWKLGLKYLERILSLTKDDIVRVAREYIDPSVAAMLVYRPEKAAPYA